MKRLLVLEDGLYLKEKPLVQTYMWLVMWSLRLPWQAIKNDYGSGFSGQTLSFTFPVIGAIGINRDDSESITPTCLAVVVQHLVEMPSNWRQQMTLDEFLKRKKSLVL